jgi:hypothetical protein
MTYDDGRVVCTDRELVIRKYYFPTGDKHIPYQRIRQVERTPLGLSKLWGSPDFTHWFNWDQGRTRKRVALVVELGKRIKPVITPDDPDGVIAALAEHGVQVSGVEGQQAN